VIFDILQKHGVYSFELESDLIRYIGDWKNQVLSVATGNSVRAGAVVQKFWRINMCDTRKLADEICDYISAPFGLGLNEYVRENVAQKIAEALKPSHNTEWMCSDCAMGEQSPCILKCSPSEAEGYPTECPFGNGTDCEWVHIPKITEAHPQADNTGSPK